MKVSSYSYCSPCTQLCRITYNVAIATIYSTAISYYSSPFWGWYLQDESSFITISALIFGPLADCELSHETRDKLGRISKTIGCIIGGLFIGPELSFQTRFFYKLT